MSDIFLGRRYRRLGTPETVWIVTATMDNEKDRRPFAVLVSEDGDATMDVEFVHLEDPALYEHLPN